MGCRHFHDLGTVRLEQLKCLVESLRHTGLEAGAVELLDHTDTEALERLGPGTGASGVGERRPDILEAGAVARIVTADHVVQQTGIEHGARDGSDLIERGCESDRPVARHTTVGGLDADRTGDGGGLTDRATRV